MEKIRATRDPLERQKLMRDMGGEMMMGGGQHGGMMKHDMKDGDMITEASIYTCV